MERPAAATAIINDVGQPKSRGENSADKPPMPNPTTAPTTAFPARP
jgi:hypothetical protein